MYLNIYVYVYLCSWVLKYVNIEKYIAIYKYVEIYINMCKYLIGYTRFPRESREIYKDLNSFIRKYLKIFEYFFVFSE